MKPYVLLRSIGTWKGEVQVAVSELGIGSTSPPLQRLPSIELLVVPTNPTPNHCPAQSSLVVHTI